ncbi:MAG: hypothetical protein KDB68_17405 [Planctomycetes bacterium]|nr:hypothetical protein [Planctomycetota bacterium]
MGKWSKTQLRDAWALFVEKSGSCKDLGVFLVNDPQRYHEPGEQVSLESSGASLADVLPGGRHSYGHRWSHHDFSLDLLVLSAGYPQPGWGLLVRWPGSPSSFEDLVRTGLRIAQAEERELSAFSDAMNAFHVMRAVGSEPKEPPELRELRGELKQRKSVEAELKTALSSITGGLSESTETKLERLLGSERLAQWLEVLSLSPELVRQMLATLKSTGDIVAVPCEEYEKRISPAHNALRHGGDRGTIFKRLAHPELKRALQATIKLVDSGAPEKEGIHKWAAGEKTRAEQQLSDALNKLLENARRHVDDLAPKYDRAATGYKSALDKWSDESAKARSTLHEAVRRATELQFRLGPKFLLGLEGACRRHNVECVSVPWDPARMVGWKLACRGKSVSVRDLSGAARELLHSKERGSSTITSSDAADGSTFTDYVHHIAVSRRGFDARNATRDLLAHIYKHSELEELIHSFGGVPSETSDRTDLAEQTLLLMGWLAESDTLTIPLARCVASTSEDSDPAFPPITSNDLRKVLENFCKDVMDTLIAELGFSQAQVWEHISQKAQRYRRKSRDENWTEERANLSVGAFLILFRPFAELAFPQKLQDISNLHKSLDLLRTRLNAASHDSVADSVDREEQDRLVRDVLSLSREIFGELPWHLKISAIHGWHPSVLSGEAWSHGSAIPRSLKVLVWDREIQSDKITIWNRSGINPIMSDPVFVGPDQLS